MGQLSVGDGVPDWVTRSDWPHNGKHLRTDKHPRLILRAVEEIHEGGFHDEAMYGSIADHTLPDSKHRSFNPVGEMELLENVVQMLLYSIFADHEAAGDLRIR